MYCLNKFNRARNTSPTYSATNESCGRTCFKIVCSVQIYTYIDTFWQSALFMVHQLSVRWSIPWLNMFDCLLFHDSVISIHLLTRYIQNVNWIYKRQFDSSQAPAALVLYYVAYNYVIIDHDIDGRAITLHGMNTRLQAIFMYWCWNNKG